MSDPNRYVLLLPYCCLIIPTDGNNQVFVCKLRKLTYTSAGTRLAPWEVLFELIFVPPMLPILRPFVLKSHRFT